MKLISRHGEGSHVTRTHEMEILFRRVLNLPDADASTKDKLVKLRRSIDIVRLAEEIERLSDELSNAYEKKLRRINSEQA
ncbi:hypothetical protein [Thermodesulfovibrio sp. TK110]